jgi:hypothetical protein
MNRNVAAVEKTSLVDVPERSHAELQCLSQDFDVAK